MSLLLKEGNKEVSKLIDHYHNIVLDTRHKFQHNKELVNILLKLNDQITNWMYYYDHQDKELTKNDELELIDALLDMINVLKSLKEK